MKLLLLPALSLCAFSQTVSEPHMATEKGEIVFVSGGDIWRVPPNGGEASLLVSHPADESRPLLSPDGTKLAFVSTRTGGGDIYVLTMSSGELKRLTFQDGLDQLDSWSRDGQWLFFHSASGDISSMNDVYKVRASGGTPIPVAADRYASEFFAAPSPDGLAVAINARGIASRQWWRNGHSNLDLSEILLVKGSPPVYERVTDGGAKEIWPMWTPDGKSLFFVSDRTGVENIWRQPLGGTSRQVTAFKDGRLLWPNITYDGKMIVFERGFGIWKMDTLHAKMAQIPIHLRGSSATPSITHVSLNSEFSELSLSPDGKKIAFVVRGEVFAAGKDGGDAQRVTRTSALEQQVSWSPDSRKLVYVSSRGGASHIYLYDFGSGVETRLTSNAEPDAAPRFSPDGKHLAYLRGGKSVWVYTFESKQERMLAPGEFGRLPLVSAKTLAWSPDSKWLAFATRGTRGFTNVMVTPLEGGAPAPVSFLANANVRGVAWSSDGKQIFFQTGQRTEEQRIARVDLVLRTPRFREDRFSDLFRAVAPPVELAAKPGPVEIVFEGIRGRLSLLNLGLDVNDFDMSADGKRLLITAALAGRENLFTYAIDETAREEAVAVQVTTTAGNKSHAQFAAGAKEAVYLERGRIQSVALDTRAARAVNVTAEMDIDFHQQKKEVFQQAWTYQRDHFFDDRFNGADWNALRATYEPLVDSARTSSDLYRLVNLMIGELNASHSGIGAAPNRESTAGAIGLRFDSAALAGGKFLINEVIPLGPAAISGIRPGDTLLTLGGKALGRDTNLQELLAYTSGKRVELTVAGTDGKTRTVAVQPIGNAAEKNLLYRAWVESRRAYVEKISSGKLGYVHMLDMGADSLSRLYVDLDAGNHSKEGVVIDVRANNGGFVNAYALDVFARKPYLTFLERGRRASPARSLLGQRSLELPTILVTNQHSLSDAEDFTEGYRRLKLGKVVGEPTAGWIVYTWNQTLIDGSSLRMPRTKVFDNDGVLMEMHPRPVDVPVQRPVGESYSGKDSQLDAAVRELLQQLEASRGKSAATENK
ncbi:MAG: PD40 domain-containing protein [Candidatus Solibacter usitatus]|nr:PD40 domain-containing protein [Candidatus Solibacter usitatus]